MLYLCDIVFMLYIVKNVWGHDIFHFKQFIFTLEFEKCLIGICLERLGIA